MAERKIPNSRTNLDRAIQNYCKKTGGDPVRTRRLMASLIVGQLLPDGAVKGGSALKIRFGEKRTRHSVDLDTARLSDLKEYMNALEASLRDGWAGFTGRIVEKEPPSPDGVPKPYIMRPFEVKLSYLGKSWLTLPLEVGHNEIGDADNPERLYSEEGAKLFEELGLPNPGRIPLMELPHQIAQKLHAMTSEGNERAHDLIDLQIIAQRASVDYLETKRVCVRLFSYRNSQTWPPRVEEGRGWRSLYLSQAEDLDVIQDFDEAIKWANRLVARIDAAGVVADV